MTISNTTKREVPPTHPGEMLREDFMSERRAITPLMALRLSRLFGNSPDFWMNAQHSYDLWESEQRFRKELSQIQPLNAA
jgi:plasmid maintenance system antidote protein VapI